VRLRSFESAAASPLRVSPTDKQRTTTAVIIILRSPWLVTATRYYYTTSSVSAQTVVSSGFECTRRMFFKPDRGSPPFVLVDREHERCLGVDGTDKGRRGGGENHFFNFRPVRSTGGIILYGTRDRGVPGTVRQRVDSQLNGRYQVQM